MLQKKVIEACSNQNYAHTGWLDSIDAALAATPLPSPPNLETVAKLKPGMAYRATFLAPAMGVPTLTTEVGRVLEHDPDKKIVVEATVCTAAKYGETFRPVTRRIFEVLPSGNTRIKTVAAVVFISSVNGMIKSMIQKGALGGMRDTFAKMESLMANVGKVQPYQEADGVSFGLPPSSAIAGAKPPSKLKNALEELVGTKVVEALDPWAGFLYAALAHLPFLGGMTSDVVLCIIVAFFSFEIVRVCVLVMKFCASAGRHPQDSLSWISYYVFNFVHVPQSVTEVFTTVCVALFAREVMVKFASLLPQPPSSGSRPSSAAGNNVGGTEGGEGQAGVKYDGYGKAIAGTNKNYVGKANKTLETLDGKSEVALDAIRQGLLEIGKLGQSNRVRAREKRQEKREKIAEKIQERRQQHAQAKGKGGSSDSAVVSPTSDVAAVAAAAAADWGGGDGATPTSAGPASPLSPQDFGASPRSPTASDYDPVEAALLDDPHHLSTEGYSGPDLSPRLRSCAVVESIFENERLQPFRGWGHDWPGHFLPTDRVLHWSTNDPGEQPDALSSQSIKEVAPLPPPGWRWVESKWHLDLSGVFSDSTDNDGWSYGLDFPWVLYPFIPGTGRKKMADFVRRRRWLRTRVPILIEVENEVEEAMEEAAEYAAEAGEDEGPSTTPFANGAGETMSGGGSGGNSGSSSGSTGGGGGGGGVAEALQQSISMERPFGSAVEELELHPSEEMAENGRENGARKEI
jgi:hypothetical protein